MISAAVFDHVIVGQDVAGRIDDEAGAQAAAMRLAKGLAELVERLVAAAFAAATFATTAVAAAFALGGCGPGLLGGDIDHAGSQFVSQRDEVRQGLGLGRAPMT